MSDTVIGLELCPALSPVVDMASKLRISVLAIHYAENGTWVLVNVRTIGGVSLLIENNTPPSTDTASESGGQDKG